MTDFVVSKVAMSICALLVAGCLSGIVGESTEPDPGADLAYILGDLQADISSLAALRGECSVAWPVPLLPNGATAEVSIAGGTAWARSGDAAMRAEVRPYPHTWGWDGTPVNWTVIEERDLSAPGLTAFSGRTLQLDFASVQVDDSRVLLLFASLSAPSP